MSQLSLISHARPTSVDAYNKIKQDGLLSKRRFQVYESIFLNGPMNNTQIAKRLDLPISSITPRVRELVKQGVVKESKVGKCPYSGHNTIFWETTDGLPAQLETDRKRTDLERLLDSMIANDLEWISFKQIQMFAQEVKK